MFEAGDRPVDVLKKLGERFDLSYPTVWRLHREWKVTQDQTAEKSQFEIEFPEIEIETEQNKEAEACVGAQRCEVVPGLPSNGPGNEVFSDDEGVTAAPIKSGKMVQHAGGLLLVAMIASFGLYKAALKGWQASVSWRDRLRMAIDAVILALGIGQKCVEGVRRLETPTAPILLRCNHAPSESWVRRIIKRYVDGTGTASKLHLRMTGVYLESARSTEDVPAVFYVDNHMRSYTGKFTLRKGWRMQEKRAKPGVTDYYVHDEDGRPVCRVEAPSHDALTDWLCPIAELIRGGIEEGQRILLAFDRAGAFPVQMAKLRDTDVEFVTYERKPFNRLLRSAFTETVKFDDGEVYLLHEKELANLGKGRGRVRRISLLTEDGNQVNLLAVSKEPAWRLIEVITGRWVQENGFKHGNERWGINQLDRRKVLNYAPDTIIPNPARRRLELSLKVAREHEGTLRRKLAKLEINSSKYKGLENDIKECLSRQAELEEQRPHLPTHAPLEKTELAGELTYHDPHYKTVIDTIRIACANAESELALALSEHLRKPTEAKMVLANLFRTTGDIRVTDNDIIISLYLIGRKDERDAIDQLFLKINDWKLTLPGDPQNRPLRFKSQI